MQQPAPGARRLASLLAVAVLAGACSQEPAPEVVQRQAASTELRSALTAGGSYRVSWTPDPDPIPLNELFALDVTVEPQPTAPAAGIAVSVDAGMPGHGHGMNTRPRTLASTEGAFRSDGLLFHMPGAWELSVEVRADGLIEKVSFPVTVK